MQITSIEEITWKIITPEPGTFPCFCCHGTNGNATHFVNAEINSVHVDMLKLPLCAKCAEYARIYPNWLEEILFQNRLKAASETMPPYCNSHDPNGDLMPTVAQRGLK